MEIQSIILTAVDMRA